MKIRNLIIVGILALAFVVTPVATQAQSVQDLQAQIQALMEQLNTLLSLHGGGTGTPAPTPVGNGCRPDEIYHPVTGQLCKNIFNSKFPIGCKSNTGFSIITGLSCSDNTPIPPPVLTTPLPPVGCTWGSYYNSLTGARCPDEFAGCPVGTVYNQLTGAKCLNYGWKPPNTPLITVFSPNGGESWFKGATQKITWKHSFEKKLPIEIRLSNASTQPPCLKGQVCPPTAYQSYLIGKTDTSRSSFAWQVGNIPLDRDNVPSGVYNLQIRVLDANGNILAKDSSDSWFKIYDNDTGNLPPSIKGVSGPTTLNVGQPGTWSVTASDPQNRSLSYQVYWGDEAEKGLAIAGASAPVQQTATFTHVFAQPGTYTNTFIVTNPDDQSAQTSLTVVVGGGVINTGYFYRFIFPGSSETMYTGQYYTIKWKSADGVNDPTRNVARYELVLYNNLGNPLQSTVVNVNDGYFQNWKVPETIPSGKYNLSIARFAEFGKDLVAVSDNFYVIAPVIPPPPTPTIISSYPPNGAIDAAMATQDSAVRGELPWSDVKLTSSSPLSDFGPLNNYFSISSSNAAGAPGVSLVRWAYRSNYDVSFSRALIPGERIRLTHKPSNSSVCLGFLPGDVNGDGKTQSYDITVLNGLVGTTEGLAQP